jgi:protein-tyrosine phosphatase
LVKEITNWRSLGGMVGADGKKVKEGLLFRSGQLFKLTVDQVDFLRDEKNIERIFDFRGPDECKEFPDNTWAGVDYVVLDILSDAQTNQASVSEIVSGEGSVDENMLITYEEMVLTNSAQKCYHDFLTTLVDDPKPIVFHCFAGKDRTGVGAALILKALDVSEDQIFTDYLKTNEQRREANQEILAELKEEMNKEQLKEVEVALTVKEDYLKRYFATVKENYGDFDNYFTKGLRLPDDFKARMQQIYLS